MRPVPVRRKKRAAFQVKGPVACFPLYALYCSSAEGFKSSVGGGGGENPEDEGSAGGSKGAAFEEVDESGGVSVGRGLDRGLSSFGEGWDDAIVSTAFGGDGFCGVYFSVFSSWISFEGTAAGEGFCSCANGDVGEFFAEGFCLIAIGP